MIQWVHRESLYLQITQYRNLESKLIDSKHFDKVSNEPFNISLFQKNKKKVKVL